MCVANSRKAIERCSNSLWPILACDPTAFGYLGTQSPLVSFDAFRAPEAKTSNVIGNPFMLQGVAVDHVGDTGHVGQGRGGEQA